MRTLPFRLAGRFITSSRGQSTLVVAGIAVGVAVQLFVGGLILGLQQGLIDKTVGNSPHIVVASSREGGYIGDTPGIIKTIRRSVPGISGLAPVFDSPALAAKGDVNKTVLLRGMSLESADAVYSITTRTYAGNAAIVPGRVLIGKELSKALDLGVGGTLKVTSPRGMNEFKVSGIFDLGVSQINRSWVIAPLKELQRIYGEEGRVTSFLIKVDNVFDADTIAKGLESDLGARGSGLSITNWKDDNAELLAGLKGQSTSSIMIQACVLVAVALGIASVLAMTVVQKSRQLGILKAMGLNNRDAGLVFLIQGLILGSLGALGGMLLGLGLGWTFAVFARYPDGTPVAVLALSPGFSITSTAIAIGISGIAALVPALRSLRLEPMEVIRNG